MNIKRRLHPIILDRLTQTKKAVIIYGARQVGKTTLANAVIQQLGLKTLSINADEYRHHEVLSSRDSRQLKALVAGYQCLLIDEAQRLPDIGLNLKILIDTCPDLKILITGSSSLELAERIAEPLTGRKWTFKLYAIAQLELADSCTPFELNEQRDARLIWGSYPEIFDMESDVLKQAYLREIVADYLLKDVLHMAQLRRSDKLYDLLRLLAFQIGNQVSIHELAQQLSLASDTVRHYIDLLEKSFVIQKLGGFSRNLRKEISKTAKYYFCDLGVRNALIQNLNPLSLREDVGRLWENFLIIERFKTNEYLQQGGQAYFWRTYTGAEIDYVEERQGVLSGFEVKWKSKAKIPKTWQETYPHARWQCISSSNWIDFVSGE